MKNNVLSAFLVFFTVVTCLLIIDDIFREVSVSKDSCYEINDENEVNTAIQGSLKTLLDKETS